MYINMPVPWSVGVLDLEDKCFQTALKKGSGILQAERACKELPLDDYAIVILEPSLESCRMCRQTLRVN